MRVHDDHGRSRVDPLAVLDCERLLDYADWCRRMARFWATLAHERPPERAERLRRSASAALYSAWQADELLKLRENWVDRFASRHAT